MWHHRSSCAAEPKGKPGSVWSHTREATWNLGELGTVWVLPSITQSSWHWGDVAGWGLGSLQDTGGLTSMGRLVPPPSSACRFYKLY